MKILAPSASMVQSMLLRLSMILRTQSSAVHSTREETHALLKFPIFICCSQYTALAQLWKGVTLNIFYKIFQSKYSSFKKKKLFSYDVEI